MNETNELEPCIISETSNPPGTETLTGNGPVEAVLTRPSLVRRIPKRWQYYTIWIDVLSISFAVQM